MLLASQQAKAGANRCKARAGPGTRRFRLCWNAGSKTFRDALNAFPQTLHRRVMDQK